MSVIISYETDEKLDLNYEEIITNVVNGAIEFINLPYKAEVSVELSDNAAIKGVNSEFRGIDSETDVLSFPALEFETPGDFESLEDELEAGHAVYFNPDTDELILGDMMISVEKVKEQAEEYGHSETRELAFLVAHSMFHLFGYDHMSILEAEEMEELQKNLLEKLGYTRDK